MVAGALPFDAQCTPRLRDQVLSGVFRIPFWMSDGMMEFSLHLAHFLTCTNGNIEKGKK